MSQEARVIYLTRLVWQRLQVCSKLETRNACQVRCTMPLLYDDSLTDARTHSDDLLLGNCARVAGVPIVDTRDSKGGSQSTKDAGERASRHFHRRTISRLRSGDML